MEAVLMFVVGAMVGGIVSTFTLCVLVTDQFESGEEWKGEKTKH